MKRITEKWNKRYATNEYVYGEEPNMFLKEKLEKLPVGNILFVGEGEGRNAVYAATLGWKVAEYDLSWEGKRKAQQLAHKNNVHIDYHVGELKEMNYKKGQFDVIAIVFTHFPTEIRTRIHQELVTYLNKGGFIILKVFSKNQIIHQANNSNAGGPKDIDMLYDIDYIKSDFDNIKIIELNETEIFLSEGLHHNSISSVIRFMGEKTSFYKTVM